MQHGGPLLQTAEDQLTPNSGASFLTHAFPFRYGRIDNGYTRHYDACIYCVCEKGNAYA